MKNYYNYLIEQYKSAIGTQNGDMSSKEFLSELSDWLKQRRDLGENYVGFLDEIGLGKILYSNTIEVGKGFEDSLVLSSYTSIITPHAANLGYIDDDRLIVSDFKVANGIPTLINSNDKKGIQILASNTYMTQNPYTPEHIKNWEQLHNSGHNDIVVGIFGSIYDKDKEHKIEQLKKFRDNLCGGYIWQYEILDDAYSYVVASTRKEKRLYK